MLLFPNATVYVSALTTTKNDEGTKIKKYDFDNPLEFFQADIQPNILTKVQIELYGINAKNANTKKCFCDISKGDFMTLGNRAKVIYNKTNAVEYYDIQPITLWRFHKEFLLIPVENENA